jgi:FlaG/FlaF family flagellin (archaellin)
MKKIFIVLVLAAAVAALPTGYAMEARHPEKQRVEVAIETRSGSLYDYILIGMHPDATDGLDNAFDTVTPGMGLGGQYIQMVVPHSDWASVKTDFRTDFRSMKKSETWETIITTDLPEGTPLTMSIDQEQSKIPAGYSVIVEDMATGIVQDLEKAAHVFPVTSSINKQFRITIRKDRRQDHH